MIFHVKISEYIAFELHGGTIMTFATKDEAFEVFELFLNNEQ